MKAKAIFHESGGSLWTIGKRQDIEKENIALSGSGHGHFDNGDYGQGYIVVGKSECCGQAYQGVGKRLNRYESSDDHRSDFEHEGLFDHHPGKLDIRGCSDSRNKLQ
ncbi:MAG TPA: hypothetical protein VII25_01280 [Candidatus Acidoferrum sp.]